VDERVLASARRAADRRGETLVLLGYPVEPVGRWGHQWDKPDNEAISALLAAYDDRLREVCTAAAGYAEALGRIPVAREGDQEPFWRNGWCPPLDAIRLYTLVAERNPALYLEVGSGNSTKFVRRAIRDHDLRTRIVSIDPQPRAAIDGLCDEVIREPLERVSLDVFDQLESGDVLFVDGSHRVFQNSDVTVTFLEVVPRLPGDVEFGVHDITLPEDYAPVAAPRFWSEQYMLGAYLLGGADGATVEYPARYIAGRPDLVGLLEPIFSAIPDSASLRRLGSSFWLRTAPRG
jgi:hypothetical protein